MRSAVTFSPSALPTTPANTRSLNSRPTSAAVRHRDAHNTLTYSYSHGEGSSNAVSPTVEVATRPASSTTSPSSIQGLSQELLANVRNDYPAAYAALHLYDRAVRHHKERFSAKEAELLRCIGVGEELLEQIDALKQRCEALARERDDAVALADTPAATAPQEREQSLQRHLAEAARTADEERRRLVEQHEAQCVRLQEELQAALQQLSIAKEEQREVEATLHRTRTQLHSTEEQLSAMEDAYHERESAYAAQRSRDLQQQQLVLKEQVAQAQQQADLGTETVLAEATVELERLQRALVRAEKELKEHQQGSQRSAAALLTEPNNAATVELANLRRQIRQLEDINHDLQLQLNRRPTESRLLERAGEESRLVVANVRKRFPDALSSKENNGGSSRSSVCGADTHEPSGLVGEEASGGASASLQRRLQEENARLRHRLQEVTRQAQDDVDEAHKARLELQRDLKSLEAQMQLLRFSVIAGLEQELVQAREHADTAEAHSRELQGIADELEVRAIAAQKDLAECVARLDEEQRGTASLKEELRSAQNAIEAARQDSEAAASEVQGKNVLIVQLQREKQQLVVALRNLQAQTTTIEGALSEMSAKHEEAAGKSDMNIARLQERCVLLEHELAEAADERVTLCARLRDAEEAVDVLKDAQRIAQEAVRDAQRTAKEVEERSTAGQEQLRSQEHVWRSRATSAEDEVERLRVQLRDTTRNVRELQEEVARTSEALRQSTDKAAALTTELRKLREARSGNEEVSRERWRQQYAQNAADREQLIRSKEQQIQSLQQEQRELRSAVVAREELAEQLQHQRQETQAALSEAVANIAAYKGRVQALEEERARVEKERAEARAEVRHLTERSERLDAGGGGNAQPPFTTPRVAELEAKVDSLKEELHSAEQQRQRAQRSLLKLVLPSTNETTSIPRSSSRDWDELLDLLDTAIGKLVAAQSSLSDSNAATTLDVDSDANSDPVDASLPEACQRAATAVLRAARDWVEYLHDDGERHRAALKHAVLAVYTTPEKTSQESDAHLSSSSAANARSGLQSSEELRDRLASAQQAFTAALSDLRREWATLTTRLTETSQRVAQEDTRRTRLEEATAALAVRDSECAALRCAVDELEGKYKDATQTHASLQASVAQLREGVTEREARLAELERRLETRNAEMKAERVEWTARWQESQRHRDKDKSDCEAELRDVRARLIAAEEAAAASAESSRRQAEESQRQLRAQLLELQKSSSVTEVTLQQQVSALTQEKAHATQGLRRVQVVVKELEERVKVAEVAMRAKEAELAATQKALQDVKHAHQQILANGVAAEAFEHESATHQVASLQLQLRTCRQDCELMEKSQAAEKAELQALRRVNASLESRLAEVEEDRAPLRQQLHSLLSGEEA